MVTSAKRIAAVAWHVTAISSCIYGLKSVHVLPDLLGINMDNEYGGT